MKRKREARRINKELTFLKKIISRLRFTIEETSTDSIKYRKGYNTIFMRAGNGTVEYFYYFDDKTSLSYDKEQFLELNKSIVRDLRLKEIEI